ncbi:MAG: zf-HC2 domain-containing protein [Actinobacteria bacterium]|nr:zf-HC2 domain-containing protein [Actinomycetota bacterium]
MTDPTMTCEQVRESAAELALGIVSGAERAAALEHLAGCPACRAEVESLSDVADELLLLAPQAEPALGFETRVTDRMVGAGIGLTSRPPRRRRLLTVAAVAACVLGVAIGFTGLYERHRSSSLDREYVNALRVLGGKALLASRLIDVSGSDSGEVFVYDGKPSWLYVYVNDAKAAGPLSVELHWAHGTPTTLAGLHADRGHGSLGAHIQWRAGGLESVRVRGSGVDYMGHFDGHPDEAGAMP